MSVKEFWNQASQEEREALLDKSGLFPDKTIEEFKKKTWGVIEHKMDFAGFGLTRLAGFVKFEEEKQGF